uniref:NTR domain-containing protein n=1 Tax=Steinernema glaseri TaxID=37863 RepID=A0A1I7ZTF7_9BILA
MENKVLSMHRNLILLASLLAVAGCTSCMRVPEKDKFCQSKFVATFTIWGSGQNATDMFYTAVPQEVFKTNGLIHPGSLSLVFTASRSEWMGINWLKHGKTYLLNGGYSGGLFINWCDAISLEEWDNVPDDVKTALREKSYAPCPGQ